MSMNRYMHPRNIYKNRPDFAQMALEYPEFKKHVTMDISGRMKLNFEDDNALRALSQTLLKKDFNLDVVMPKDKLIPTIPLRLNYLLWIEDLLSISSIKNEHIIGLDVGTGCTCVYPLMAARKYGWKMIGNEINQDSFESAQENIKRNKLNHLVEVYKNSEDCLIYDYIVKCNFPVDFTMCNPPFFSNMQEINTKRRNINRPKPKNAFCCDKNEVSVEGGELQFLYKLAKESQLLKDKVRIYTSMVGCQKNLACFKKFLRQIDVVSFKQTEFCQGNTTRWGIAWTFCEIDLRKVPESTIEAWRKEKKRPMYEHQFKIDKKEVTLAITNEKVKEIMKELSIDFKEFASNSNIISYNITAKSNTWSNSRRKRREMARLMGKKEENGSCSPPKITVTEKIKHDQVRDCETNKTNLENEQTVRSDQNVSDVFMNSLSISDKNSDSAVDSFDSCESNSNLGNLGCLNCETGASNKRCFDDDTEYYNHKKLRTKSPILSKPLLEATLVIKSNSEGYLLKLIFVDSTDSTGKNLLYQVLQYFINNLKF